MASSPSGRPSWQRNSVFKFFSSIKLAVVLLAVLIIASIAGTIYESSFDAKVARAYVYGARWFNLWLLLLVANLTVSALSRWPWRKHHVAFLVTHLGIITLLFGSLIGRIWGTEGTITLFKGEPPSNRLLIDQHQLRVRDTDGLIKGYPAEFINRPPTPQRPWDLGPLASGARLSIIEYAPAVEGKLNPKPLESEGRPAIHFTISHCDDGATPRELAHGRRSPARRLRHGSGQNRAQARDAHRQLRLTNPNLPKRSRSRNQSSLSRRRRTNRSPARPKVAAPARRSSCRNPNPATKGASQLLSAASIGLMTSPRICGRRRRSKAAPSSCGSKAIGRTSGSRMASQLPSPSEPNNPAVVVTLRGRAVPVAAAPDAHGAGDPKETGAGQSSHTLYRGRWDDHL